MINIEINEQSIKVPSGDVIIQSCSRIGIEIPRFCFHEKLTIAGNCRMCLVEVIYPKSIKPIASCALPVVPSMKILTNTLLVKKARESVLEFLLANHPLDCPVCDQGGECDLQDETLLFGSDRGRFYENKRAVEDKECGPLIKTVMTRCIHCTRCIRYLNEIAGVEYFGALGRGSLMEIGTFIEKGIDSEISGNVIDLCPVGALTSKPYSFTARPWELRTVQTYDILDSFCSSIRIDLRGSEVVRVLPLLNVEVNEEWISDRTRFFYDGLKRQRLQVPMVRNLNSFIECSWLKSVTVFKNVLNYFLFSTSSKNLKNSYFNKNSQNFNRILGLIGSLVDLETIIVFKQFLISCQSLFFFFNNMKTMNGDFRHFYTSIRKSKVNWTEIFFKADICLILNLNLRLELPLLNIKLRKAVIENNLLILNIGFIHLLNYNFIHVANNISNFLQLLEGRNIFCRKLIESKYPLILINSFNENRIGYNTLQKNILYFQKYLSLFKKDWLGLHLINLNTGNINGLEVGFNINENFFSIMNSNLINFFVYIINGEFSFIKKKDIKRSILLYQGHNGDLLTKLSDLIFPSSNFLEKRNFSINFEGHLRMIKQILPLPGLSRIDYDILSILNVFKKKNTKHILNGFLSESDIISKYGKNISPIFLLKSSSFIESCFFFDHIKIYERNTFNNLFITSFFSEKFTPYLNDSISRSSQILSLCEQRFVAVKSNYI